MKKTRGEVEIGESSIIFAPGFSNSHIYWIILSFYVYCCRSRRELCRNSSMAKTRARRQKCTCRIATSWSTLTDWIHLNTSRPRPAEGIWLETSAPFFGREHFIPFTRHCPRDESRMCHSASMTCERTVRFPSLFLTCPTLRLSL